MRFVIREIILWLKNGKKRKLEFYNNKVNVVTGDSGTGKSVIIDIIDYCFFASKTKIPQEKINENILWYGINFEINDKYFTIARKSFDIRRKVSDKYYFSAIGKVPDIPVENNGEDEIKKAIEQEFSIDSNVIIPYGGKKIKAGSKISLRYFFLFNTQSGDTIDHSEVFFDKQNDEKYIEALHRIFNLATGIDTVKNILIKEKIDALEKDIMRLNKKKTSLEKQERLFDSNLRELIKKAKEYDLIKEGKKNLEEDINELRQLVAYHKENNYSSELRELDKLQKRKNEITRKIRSYNRFKYEYEKYRKLEEANLDSLKPVEYLKDNNDLVVQHPVLRDLLEALENEMNDIKKELKNKRPFNINVNSELKELNNQLTLIEQDIAKLPTIKQNFEHVIQKYIFIGEIKTRLEIFDLDTHDYFDSEELEKKNEELDILKSQLENETIDKELVIRLLEELVQKYLDESSDALGIYSDYKAVFEYNKKVLKLKKTGALVPSVVGSSSNHMFMHLCFMLGLHELIIKQEAPFVPSLLIFDQPSRPYYGEGNNNKNKKKTWKQIPQDDRTKITIAFRLLDKFINYMNMEYKTDFQVIVFEHIPQSIWLDAKLKNVTLVDKEFRDGNALIPEDMLK